MSSGPRPTGTRLLWSLRSFGWMVVACALAGAAVPYFTTPSAPLYESDSLVIARDIPVDKTVLPRLGQAVFSSGPVAAAVAAEPQVTVAAEDLIPERLSLVAAEDSIVYVVQARATEPMIAAGMADQAAVAFVEELNKSGAGVGEFAVQTQAIVPTQPLETVDRTLLVVGGALGGAVLGLALVALIAAVRRPIISPSDVEASLGAPVLGTLELHGPGLGALDRPSLTRGIAAVARRLATVPHGRLLLIAPRSAAALRRSVYVLVAVALGLLRPLHLETDPEVADVVRTRRAEHRRALPAAPGASAQPDLTLVDSGSTVEIVDPARTTLSVVAVIPRGIPSRRLRQVVEDYLGEELVGVVLVDVRSGIWSRFTGRLGAIAVPGRAQSQAKAPVAARDLRTELS